MEKGYMRIGEMAKKTGTNTNTLRYYDKEGLLSPSMESEGGYRLYTDQDMVKLIQIQTMKELGFTLSEIKKYLVSLDTPGDMVAALTEHETAIEKRMAVLSESLRELKALKAEVMQMQTMDFEKYAAILINLQMKNDNYWVIKHMDSDLLDYLGSQFANNEDGALRLINTMNSIQKEIEQLMTKGVPPDSQKGQDIAKTIMEVMFELTQGDLKLMLKFTESIEKLCGFGGEQIEEFRPKYDYLRAAVDTYIATHGFDSFGDIKGRDAIDKK